MTWYYITYCLFVLFLSMNIGAYSQFKGASQKHYNLLQNVSGWCAIAFIVFSICHFFIIGWIMALVLIIGALLFAPTIGMRLGRNIAAIVAAPYLTIILAIVFWSIQTYYLGWWGIYHA